MATKLTTVKRQSYTVSDKLRIIQFAEQHGNRAAEREFGVSESNVRLWQKSITNNLDGSEDELVYNSTEIKQPKFCDTTTGFPRINMRSDK